MAVSPVTFFHARAGVGFPVANCTYFMLDLSGNETGQLDRTRSVRVHTERGVRVILRDPADICAFLITVGRLPSPEAVR